MIVVCLCVFLVHVFVGVFCDLLCGDVWLGFVCVLCLSVPLPWLKKCVLFVIDCVMWSGLFLCERFKVCVRFMCLCFACDLMCDVVCFVLLRCVFVCGMCLFDVFLTVIYFVAWSAFVRVDVCVCV